MKKAAFVIVAILLLGTINAQTKPKQKVVAKPKPSLEQTMNWIVEKLNANSINYYSSLTTQSGVRASWTYSYNNFIFDSQNQLLQFNEKNDYTTIGSAVDVDISDHTITIPLSKIYKVEYGESFVVENSNEGRKNMFLTIITYGKDISDVNSTRNTSDLSTSIIITLDFTREPNLFQRLQKAFADVKSHFPKKQETY